MASDNRKQRILNHLTKSADGINYTTAKPTTESSPTPPPIIPETPPLPAPPKAEDPKERKRKVMDHVKLSSDSFSDFSLTPQNRPQKIQEHLRKSLN